MFEFLNTLYDEDLNVCINEEWFNGDIVGYNPKTNKLVLSNKENKSKKEFNLFDETHIEYNINYYEEWESKLYNSLIRNNGKTLIQIFSTETQDSWFVEIYRHKTLLPTHEYEEEITLTNYVIVCNGEVKGDILSRRHKKYSGCAIDEEAEFKEWINEQIDKVSEFNNSECWDTFSGIIASDAFNTNEEIETMWNMFNEIDERNMSKASI